MFYRTTALSDLHKPQQRKIKASPRSLYFVVIPHSSGIEVLKKHFVWVEDGYKDNVMITYAPNRCKLQ
jgi:hypothetical protein